MSLAVGGSCDLLSNTILSCCHGDMSSLITNSKEVNSLRLLLHGQHISFINKTKIQQKDKKKRRVTKLNSYETRKGVSIFMAV